MFPKTTHILVVDDTKGIRVLIGKFLREIGFEKISEAENGKEALQKLESLKKTDSPIGLVIADIRMPVMDGLELLKKVRESNDFKNLPYVALTAESEKESVVKAIKAGINEYIIKPASKPLLEQKLAKAYSQIFGEGSSN